MALTSMPYLTIQELDANGNPYNGAKLFFYAAGTTTKQNTYADANGSSANANPVVLDSAGRATVFFQPLTYDVVLAPSTDSDPPVSPYWSRLGITAVPVSSGDLDISGTAGESLSAGDAVYLSDGSGSKTAGNWYKGDADFTYASSLAPQIGMVQDAIASGASGSIRIGGRVTGLSGLTAGTKYYISTTAGAITATPPTNAKQVGAADSTTSIIIGFSIPDATATVSGLVNITAQTFGGVKTFTNAVLVTPSISAPDFTAIPTGIGGTIFNRVTSTATVNNSSTLVNITGMSFAVLANAVYTFEFVIMGATTSTVSDWKFALTGPAAPTSIRYGAKNNQAPNQIVLSSFTSWTVQGYSGTTEEVIVINGVLANGANAGTVQLQFAQSVANASNTTISVNSHVIAMRVS